MILHKGETLFRQGESGPLFKINSGLLKIIRVHENGTQFLLNVIVPGEIIPHHSLISHSPYFGTAVALTTCEIDVIPESEWYMRLEQDPKHFRQISLILQERLRMMQQRIDQLTTTAPADKLNKLEQWFRSYIDPVSLTDILTQDEIGQFIGLRRETINRLLRSKARSSQSSRNETTPT